MNETENRLPEQGVPWRLGASGFGIGNFIGVLSVGPFVASLVENLAMGSAAHEASVKLAARLDLFVFQGQVPEEEAAKVKHLVSRVSAMIAKPAP